MTQPATIAADYTLRPSELADTLTLLLDPVDLRGIP